MHLALGGVAMRQLCLQLLGNVSVVDVWSVLTGLAGKTEGGESYLPNHPSWLRLSSGNLMRLVLKQSLILRSLAPHHQLEISLQMEPQCSLNTLILSLIKVTSITEPL